MDVITTRGLTKYYGKTRGVEDLSMCVPEGARLRFLGPNGSGKTTTIRCLLGMLKTTSGEPRCSASASRLTGRRCMRASDTWRARSDCTRRKRGAGTSSTLRAAAGSQGLAHR